MGLACPSQARGMTEMPVPNPVTHLAAHERFRARWVVVLGTCLLSAYLLVSAWWCLPIPCQDSQLFMGTAIRFAQGHGLTHPAYRYRGLDPAGVDRVVTYPPLFHWLVGSCMPSPDPRWAFVIVALMRGIQLFAWGWVFLKILESHRDQLGRWRAWLVLLLLFAIGGQSGNPMEGRPEAFVGMVQALTVVGLLRIRERWHPAVLGLALGVIGAAHPVAAILSVALVTMYAGLRWRFLGAVRCLTVAGVISAAIFLGVVSASGLGVGAILNGMSRVVEPIIVQAWGSLSNLLLSGRAPFCGMLILAGIAGAAAWYWRHRERCGCLWLAGAGWLLFVGAAWYFSLRAPARFYNAALFAPFYLAVLILLSLEARTAWRGALRCIAVGCVVFGLGEVRYAATMACAAARGVSFTTARSLVAGTLARFPGAKIQVPNNGMILMDDYSRMQIECPENVEDFCDSELVLLLQSTWFDGSAALLTRGYVEVASTARWSGPSWLPAWSSGYYIRIYHRAPTSPAAATAMVRSGMP